MKKLNINLDGFEDIDTIEAFIDWFYDINTDLDDTTVEVVKGLLNYFLGENHGN